MMMCIDYQKLNKITIRNWYPLLTIDDIFDQLQRASVFPKIYSGFWYHQLKIRLEDITKTTFWTHYGLYDFLFIRLGGQMRL